MQWLSVRQETVAQNIANANTPGVKAMDVRPFEDVLSDTGVTMVATNPAHFGSDPMAVGTIETKQGAQWEVTASGNSISLEQEMIKAGEVNRAYSLNTSIVKAFNQMLSTSVKG